MRNQPTKKVDILRLTQLAILLALEAIMAFTPMGFVIVPPISITLMHIPVIIGAILLGPVNGGILGLGFGIFSMIRAATSGNPADVLFSPFASGDPIGSIVMCVISRVMLGVFAGLIFMFIKKFDSKKFIAIIITAGVSTVLHTIMVIGFMGLFFTDFPLKDVLGFVVKVNSIVEICVAMVLCVAVCKPLLKLVKGSSAPRAARRS